MSRSVSGLFIKRNTDVGFNAFVSTPSFLKCVTWEMGHVFVHGGYVWNQMGPWAVLRTVLRTTRREKLLQVFHCSTVLESRVISLSYPLWLCSLCWDRGIPCSDGRLCRSFSYMSYWHFTLLLLLCHELFASLHHTQSCPWMLSGWSMQPLQNLVRIFGKCFEDWQLFKSVMNFF